MKCTEVEEKWLLARTGELDEAAGRELDEHIAGCERCRRMLAGTQALLDTVSNLPRMPEALEARILAAAQARPARTRTALPYAARRLGLAAAVSAAAIVLFSLLVVPRLTPPAQPAPAEPVASTDEPAPEEQIASVPEDDTAAELTRELQQALTDLDTAPASALDTGFSDEFETVKKNIEVTEYMLTTSGKAGLEKQIGDVRSRIETLREEMTALALYTPEQN
jgi:anti-sigma factor RsiW